MANLPLILTSILIGLYGILNVFAGFLQLKQKKIPFWSAALMLASGSLIFASGIMLLGKFSYTLPVLVAGLAAIHGLAISNGLYLYGKITLQHHIFRFAISIVLLGLAFVNIK